MDESSDYRVNRHAEEPLYVQPRLVILRYRQEQSELSQPKSLNDMEMQSERPSSSLPAFIIIKQKGKFPFTAAKHPPDKGRASPREQALERNSSALGSLQ